MSNKTALITGTTGQDGYYLSRYLLQKGYRVVGGYFGGTFKKEDFSEVELVELDLSNEKNIEEVFEQAKPDEIYNLASCSFPPFSWDNPEKVIDVNAVGVLRILNLMKSKYPDSRLFTAASSEIFGNPEVSPQTESTPMKSRNPYGASKILARNLVNNYREKYGMYVCNGILYSHESYRRDITFVTNKVIAGVKYISGKSKENPVNPDGNMPVVVDGKIHLGNLDSRKDWGYAGDYVKAMHAILQQDIPDDYIICTGKTHSVAEFVAEAFKYANIDNWKDYVVIDDKYWRPAEKVQVTGDNSKIKKIIDFDIDINLKDLVKRMFEE